jgi:hypothetical protein
MQLTVNSRPIFNFPFYRQHQTVQASDRLRFRSNPELRANKCLKSPENCGRALHEFAKLMRQLEGLTWRACDEANAVKWTFATPLLCRMKQSRDGRLFQTADPLND